MTEFFDNPVVHEMLKTSGPMGLVAMMGWVAWWVDRKDRVELERRLFKMSSMAVQTNTRMEAALRALRELVRERMS